MRCLRIIFGMSLREEKRSTEIHKVAKQQRMSSVLMRKRLCFLGHIKHMKDKHVLAGETLLLNVARNQLRRSGSSPEEVRLLAEKFHMLVHKHSKLVKEANKLTAKTSKQMRRECHRDIHRFASRDRDDECCVPTAFIILRLATSRRAFLSSLLCHSQDFQWMPDCLPSSIPMSTAPFTEEELSALISGLKSSFAPSHCPDMCEQGVYQPGEEEMENVSGQQPFPQHCQTEGLHQWCTWLLRTPSEAFVNPSGGL